MVLHKRACHDKLFKVKRDGPLPRSGMNIYRNRRNTKMDLVKAIEQDNLRNSFPEVSIGDYVKVHLKIKEGARERIQVFEGTVIARKGGGLSETMTVRRVSYGVGVERILPVHSPKIDKIEIVRKGRVRRAKLYYLRDRVGKAAKITEKLAKRT
jgi:large subunit ribosomal protein L19